MNAKTKKLIHNLVSQKHSREYITAAAWTARDNNTSMTEITTEIAAAENAALRAENAEMKERIERLRDVTDTYSAAATTLRAERDNLARLLEEGAGLMDELQAERDELREALTLITEIHPTRNTHADYVTAVNEIARAVLAKYQGKEEQ